LSNDVEPVPPGSATYAVPSAYLWAVASSAASIWAGVAAGLAWKSWATMPDTCGVAIDVPLIVL
jgi:hypothetical protein